MLSREIRRFWNSIENEALLYVTLYGSVAIVTLPYEVKLHSPYLRSLDLFHTENNCRVHRIG